MGMHCPPVRIEWFLKERRSSARRRVSDEYLFANDQPLELAESFEIPFARWMMCRHTVNFEGHSKLLP
ncbi:hypothetical protein CEY09_23995 [Achromobacter marplatensis]|nr:hypothetical protein CEY09_23995 [Achromobacter marplatensis]